MAQTLAQITAPPLEGRSPLLTGGALLLLESAAPEVPIVVLSEQPELAEQALLVGAQEVLRPDADEAALRGALRRAVLRKQADRQVRYLASHDALTGLNNTALFHERLSQCIARVQRDNAACAVFYLDLDGFKPINDSLGHAAGDHLLRIIAGRLGEAIRSCDTAARLGGDEFALLLEDVYDREAVQHVAQRVLRSLSAPVSLKKGLDVRITSSIGVALCPQSGQTAESVLHAADTAMFAAKKAGKSQYRFAGDARGATATPRPCLLDELRHAVIGGDFYLVYQPQLELQRHRVIGVEALLRWRRRNSPAVGPDEFVPMLEQLDLIGTVGASVLAEACSYARSCSRPGLAPLRVSVNVSPLQLEDPGFPKFVSELLARHELVRGQLELEVTEGMLLQPRPRVLSTLRALRQRGVRIALDDFGTGYAALGYLREFPLDVIKIDPSFVAPLATDDRARILVGAIIDLARQLGIQVVAEGVETPAQLAYLRDRGCHGCQGYLFGKPRHAESTGSSLH